MDHSVYILFLFYVDIGCKYVDGVVFGCSYYVDGSLSHLQAITLLQRGSQCLRLR